MVGAYYSSYIHSFPLIPASVIHRPISCPELAEIRHLVFPALIDAGQVFKLQISRLCRQARDLCSRHAAYVAATVATSSGHGFDPGATCVE